MSIYRIELFGWPRILTGCRVVELDLKAPATLGELIASLGERYPALYDSVLDAQRASLIEGYIVNLNERRFTREMATPVKPEDTILLLSGMAGGGA